METFEEILTAGGHTNSLGRSGEVLKAVQNDPSKIDELFRCIQAEDAWVRMRAIDTFEKLVKDDPELARPYLSSIFTDLTTSSQASIQWHLAQLFAEIELNEQQKHDAIAWLTSKIKSTEVDWIVSVNVMRTLLYFHKAGLIRSESLRLLFKTQASHKSKSVRKKAELFLTELKATNS